MKSKNCPKMLLMNSMESQRLQKKKSTLSYLLWNSPQTARSSQLQYWLTFLWKQLFKTYETASVPKSLSLTMKRDSMLTRLVQTLQSSTTCSTWVSISSLSKQLKTTVKLVSNCRNRTSQRSFHMKLPNRMTSSTRIPTVQFITKWALWLSWFSKQSLNVVQTSVSFSWRVSAITENSKTKMISSHLDTWTKCSRLRRI